MEISGEEQETDAEEKETDAEDSFHGNIDSVEFNCDRCKFNAISVNKFYNHMMRKHGNGPLDDQRKITAGHLFKKHLKFDI